MATNSNVSPVHSSATWIDAIAVLLIAYGAMNLNGIAQAATGLEGYLSPIVLVCSLMLIATCYNAKLVGDSYSWFLAFGFAYFVGGMLPLVSGVVEIDRERLIAYVGTFIYCSALYFYIARRGYEGLLWVFGALQIAFFIDCIAVLNDKFIVDYFSIDRPQERASGFFDNPNEASVMALYFIILIVTTARKINFAVLLKFTVAVAALLLTFSKTGILLLMLLSAVFLCARRMYGRLVLGIFSLVLLLPAIHVFTSVNPLDLTDDQVLRIEQVVNVVGGEVDNTTTTGRVELWKEGIHRISQTIPLGSGIGSYHRMVGGGYIDLTGDWLGVHSTFLMVLGESGLIPFLIFLGFLFVLARTALLSSTALTMAGCLIVFISDMFVTHGVLSLRIHNVMLAVIMAASLHARDWRKRPLH